MNQLYPDQKYSLLTQHPCLSWQKERPTFKGGHTSPSWPGTGEDMRQSQEHFKTKLDWNAGIGCLCMRNRWRIERNPQRNIWLSRQGSVLAGGHPGNYFNKEPWFLRNGTWTDTEWIYKISYIRDMQGVQNQRHRVYCFGWLACLIIWTVSSFLLLPFVCLWIAVMFSLGTQQWIYAVLVWYYIICSILFYHVCMFKI